MDGTYQRPSKWAEWDWSIGRRPTIVTLKMFHCVDCDFTTQLIDDHSSRGRAVTWAFNLDHSCVYHRTILVCDTAFVEGDWTPEALQSLADAHAAKIEEVKLRGAVSKYPHPHYYSHPDRPRLYYLP